MRLLLPARFDTAPAQRWPVLYLLHGCCDSYVAWTRSTDVAALTRPLDVLVAIPEGDEGVDAQVDLYGAGTHNWVYRQPELHLAWPLLTAGLGLPA